ncbi:TetR/AcrR family transcriptional regulator [Alteromonas sp. A079]|uniref:TetR/AcrR family transcriptional regulator n=1 Tax=Alteromonas sp. A079 TaxID=3410268 RepID=UPI003B9E9B6D
MDQPTKRQGRPKSEEKRRLILNAASSLFLQEGFANTSMDSVAKASGVSKQTVYSHFDSKDTLFQAAIKSKCQSYQLDTQHIDTVSTSDVSFEACMSKVGTQFIKLLQDPETIAIFRVIIAEAGNNAHVAKLFYQAGPESSLVVLSNVIYDYGKGRISQPIANQLAVDFCALLKAEHHTMMLCGIQAPLLGAALFEHVSAAVDKISLLFNHYIK